MGDAFPFSISNNKTGDGLTLATVQYVRADHRTGALCVLCLTNFILF